MEIPKVPAYTMYPKNCLNIYAMQPAEIENLFKYLWSEGFLNSYKKATNSPFDTLVSLMGLPINPNGLQGSMEKINLGNEKARANGYRVTNEFVQVDCGTVEIKPKYIPPPPADPMSGVSYFDLDPFTKFMLFLPFVGFVDVSANHIMTKSLHIVYNVNISDGSCVAFLEADGIVFAQYEGNCAFQVPLSQIDNSAKVRAALDLSLASIPLAVGLSLALGPAASTALVPAGTAAATTAAAKIGTGLAVSGGVKALGVLSNAAAGGTAPTYSMSGKLTSVAACMSYRKPFLIRIMAQPVIPSTLNKELGRLVMASYPLSSLKGFTVATAHITSDKATKGEIQEIENKLTEGVIF